MLRIRSIVTVKALPRNARWREGNGDRIRCPVARSDSDAFLLIFAPHRVAAFYPDRPVPRYDAAPLAAWQTALAEQPLAGVASEIGRFNLSNRILRSINGLGYTRQPSCIDRPN